MKKWIILIMVVLMATVSYSADDKRNYLWNESCTAGDTTCWIPALATTDGKQKIHLNLVNISSENAIYSNNVTIQNHLTVYNELINTTISRVISWFIEAGNGIVWNGSMINATSTNFSDADNRSLFSVVANLTQIPNNETINNTIDARTVSTTYYPTWNFTLYGTNDGGNSIGNLSYADGETYNVTEDVGVNALEIYINFTGVDKTPDFITMGHRYTGTHLIYLEVWDYTDSEWEIYDTIVEQPSLIKDSIALIDGANHVQNEEVKMRFRHPQAGNPSHYFEIDFLNLVNGFSTVTTSEHDGLSERNDFDTNHPFYAEQFSIVNNSIMNNDTVLNVANASGFIIDWNESGYIFDWNESGLITNQTQFFDDNINSNASIENYLSDKYVNMSADWVLDYDAGEWNWGYWDLISINKIEAVEINITNRIVDNGSILVDDPAYGTRWNISREGTISGYDNSLNEDLRFDILGDSWLGENGNLGIGTTSPRAPLEIKGKDSSNLMLVETTGDERYNISINTAGDLEFTNDVGLIVARFVDNWGAGTGGTTNDVRFGDGSTRTSLQLRSDNDADEYAVLSLFAEGSREGFIAQGATNLYIGNSGGTTYTDAGLAGDADITIDTDGKVGIGQASPDSLLQLDGGNITIEEADSKINFGTTTDVGGGDLAQIKFEEGVGSYDVFEFLVAANKGATKQSSAYIRLNASDDATGSGTIHFGTDSNDADNAIDRMIIDETGDVGIGTGDPSGKLDVAGNTFYLGDGSTGDPGIYMDSGNDGNIIFREDEQYFDIETGAAGGYDTPHLVINADSGQAAGIRLGPQDEDSGHQIYTNGAHALVVRAELNPDADPYTMFIVQSSGSAERLQIIQGATGFANTVYDSFAVGAAGDTSPSVTNIDLGTTSSGDLWVADDIELNGDLFVGGNIQDVTSSDALSLNDNVKVTGHLNTTGNINATGNLFSSGNFELSGDYIVGDNKNLAVFYDSINLNVARLNWSSVAGSGAPYYNLGQANLTFRGVDASNPFVISAEKTGVDEDTTIEHKIAIDALVEICAGDCTAHTQATGEGELYVEGDLEIDGEAYISRGAGGTAGAYWTSGDVAEHLHTKESRENSICGGDLSCYQNATDDDLDYGDLVCIDPTINRTIFKCNEANSHLAIGFVSATFALNIGLAEGYPIAIAGLVPSHVTNENGNVNPGDLLVSSSKPGYAMKAINPKDGTIVGKAFDFCENDDCKIAVFVALS